MLCSMHHECLLSCWRRYPGQSNNMYTFPGMLRRTPRSDGVDAACSLMVCPGVLLFHVSCHVTLLPSVPPGIGLGALTCHAKIITDRMLYVAAVTLAQAVHPDDCKVRTWMCGGRSGEEVLYCYAVLCCAVRHVMSCHVMSCDVM